MKSYIVLLLLLIGCNIPHKLDDKWEPLTHVVEGPGGSGWVTTISPFVFVGDLEKFLEKRPVDSAPYNSILLHERWHALTQEEMGLEEFLLKYATNQKFRWEQERLGWYLEIELAMRQGHWIDPRIVKSGLKKYTPSLASDSEIDEWVDSVYNGSFVPPPGIKALLDSFE